MPSPTPVRLRASPRALVLVATLSALGALAAPARAGGTVDLARKETWKPGDAVTVTLREDQVREFKVPSRDDAGDASKPQRLKTQVVQVERCLETDAEGRRVRWAVGFLEWSVDNGTTKDESLKGAVLEVSGAGKDRKWALTSSPQEPTKPARAWLERRFGAGRRDAADVRQAWLPKAPVAVGDTWSADLAAYVGGQGGDRIDLAKATSKCTLTSADGGVAKVTCEAALPFTAIPGGKSGPAIPWKSGGTQQLKGTISLGLEGRLVTSTSAWSSTLSGEAESDGKTFSVVLKTDRSLDVKVGGELPPESTKKPDPAPAMGG